MLFVPKFKMAALPREVSLYFGRKGISLG